MELILAIINSITLIIIAFLTFYHSKKLKKVDNLGDFVTRLDQKRLELYPKIVNLVYRLRNSSREIMESNFDQDSQEVENFSILKDELIEELYGLKI